MALTDKQQAFVEYYLTHWNATEAARQAGYSGNYSTLRSIGSENLTKPNIRQEIEQRLSDLKMNADEAVTRLSAMARGASMLDLAAVFMQESTPESLAVAHRRGLDVLIKKVKKTKAGLEIELYDAQSALTTILKILGLFKDIEISHDININLEIRDAVRSRLDDLYDARRINELPERTN